MGGNTNKKTRPAFDFKMRSLRIASFPGVLLLGLLLGLVVVEASPYPRPYPQMTQVRRLPRRNDFVAYNLHRIIRPRDVNDLGVDQARKAMHDVHETIAEVQRLLALDPSLPRLTRGEIEELFENVTREEFSKSLRAGDHSRAQHMRALMLVLPYHANNMSPENLQQIYTRPPVTRIVGATPAAVTSQPPRSIVGGTNGPLAPARLIATTTPPPPPPEVTTRARSTTPSFPVTTIRFTTPRPTTFHPTLPERMGLRQEELNDILASIGLSQTSSEELASLPNFRPMPMTTTTTEEPPTTEPVTTTSSSTTPFPTESSGINNAINVDDPKVAQELKDLLRSFGLLKEDSDNSIGLAPLAGIESDKPLDEELDVLLKSFGLLGPGPRNKKSMLPEAGLPAASQVSAHEKPPVMKSMPVINPDLVAPQLMSVLGTLGIQMQPTGEEHPLPAPVFRRREKTGRKLDPPTASAHGDDQAARLRVSNEDYRKLEQLWQTVKQLEKLNENLTDDSLDALNPKHYNLSPTLLAQQGPDPLDGGDSRDRLNEIKKRQQPSTADANGTGDSPTRFSLELNTNGTASELSSLAIDDEPLPPPRRTGFYFLYDWNTFLEVGEEPNKIIIRYNPRAGDPSRFLPVNVP
uniref:Uncharacterized protein n=1 Tax=Anopheles atroparvus TaxID=41427 RepID=A0A182JI24_ANOAO